MDEVQARRGAAWRFVRAVVRAQAGGSHAIFAQALRLDASCHDRVGPGEPTSPASSDSEHVRADKLRFG
jgi:hypothetical protein